MLRLPASHALRNLWRRPVASLLTAAGIAAVVFAATIIAALARGVEVRLEATGDPRNLLMISRKGQGTIFSSIEPDELVNLGQLPGLANGPDGLPLISPELHHVTLARPGERESPVHVRGVETVAYDVHPSVRVIAGRLPERPFEVLAGTTAHVRFGVASLPPGSTVSFENQEWEVVGCFSDGGGLHEGELWVRAGDLLTSLRRRTYSLVVARMVSQPAAATALGQFSTPGPIERSFKGWIESAHYREALGGLSWLFWVARLMLAAVLVAGALICVNTMLTAVGRRLRELATQRVLGFTRADLASGLVIEALCLALLGGAAGLAAGYGIGGWSLALNQNAFFLTVDGVVAGTALTLAATIGACGAVASCWRALRLPIVLGLAQR
jgi:putative ABC transport system permease protein